MKKLLLASVAVLAFSGAAQAADLPSKRSAVVPYAPVMGVWSGFYVGAHAGMTSGNFQSTDTLGVISKVKAKDSSFSGGALVGYNYQMNNYVLGLEADYTAFELSKSKVVSTGAGALEQSADYLVTVRGRVGYAVDKFLPFVTAGVAFTNSENQYNTLAGALIASQSKTRTGLALGAGVDYAFTNNIIGRVEYQYATFNDKFNFVSDKAKLDLHTVRAAVAYKF